MLGFGAVGKFFGKMFGSDEACGKLVDNISSGLDKLIYTDEEKADNHAKSVTEARYMLIEWLKSTSGASLTRRFLAVLLSLTWVGMLTYCAIMSAMSPFICLLVKADAMMTIPDEKGGTIIVSKAVFITQAAQQSVDSVGTYAMGITGAMMLILGFYFAAPHLDKIVTGAMGKFQNTFKG